MEYRSPMRKILEVFGDSEMLKRTWTGVTENEVLQSKKPVTKFSKKEIWINWSNVIINERWRTQITEEAHKLPTNNIWCTLYSEHKERGCTTTVTNLWICISEKNINSGSTLEVILQMSLTVNSIIFHHAL